MPRNQEVSWTLGCNNKNFHSKLEAIKALQEAILELKLSPETKSKKTIQLLQQKLDELTS